MQKFGFTFLFVMSSVLFGCNLAKSPEFKVPDFQLDPKTQELLNQLNACNKDDTELPLDQVGNQDPIIVKDKIDSMDILFEDCDGTKSAGGHGPVRDLSQFISVTPPETLKENISFVQIENFRTCSVQRVDASDEMFLGEQNPDPTKQGGVGLPPPISTTVAFDGRLKVSISDAKFKLAALFLNVHDHNNVVKITYYGKCQKYKDTKDPALGEAYNCVEAPVLAEKTVLIKVEVERPDVPGTYTKSICTK